MENQQTIENEPSKEKAGHELREGAEVELDTQQHVRPRYKLIVPFALLALGALAAVLLWPRHTSQGASSKPATAAAKATPPAANLPPDVVTADDKELALLTIEPVTVRTLDTERETTGKVGYNEDRVTPIFPNCAGRVQELRANKGDVVQTGQTLMVIESPDLVLAQNDLVTGRAAESQAATVESIAQRALVRAQNLHEREAISTKDLQQAEADYARAKDDVQRTRAALRVAESKLALYGKTPEEIARLGELGKKNVEQVDSRVEIRAPFSGTIVERKVGPGQYAKLDAQEPLLLISDLSTLWVQADVYESFLANVRVGAPVSITMAAYPNRVFRAHVSFISPTVDPTTRTVHVRCVVQNTGNLLKPEMFAKIKLGGAVPQTFPVVPAGAIIAQNNANYVLIEEAHGRFRRREVKTGREVEGVVTITAGLKPGERVVTHGVLLLNALMGKAPENQAEKE